MHHERIEKAYFGDKELSRLITDLQLRLSDAKLRNPQKSFKENQLIILRLLEIREGYLQLFGITTSLHQELMGWELERLKLTKENYLLKKENEALIKTLNNELENGK